MRRILVALATIAIGLVSGCALPLRTVTPPAVGGVTSGDVPAGPQVRPNGARILILEEGDAFVGALLFAAGPVNDPPNLPGLGEWMVQSAIMDTERRVPGGDTPGVRALRLGGELIPVANGGVLGWAVTGPPQQAEELLALLGDVALRPSFPATEMELAAAHRREHQRAEGDEAVSLAIAVAIGAALGLDRPLWLSTPLAMLSRVTREDVARHWRRVVRPGAAALVVQGARAGQASPLLGRLDGWRPSPLQTVDPRVCSPQGLTSHLVESRTTPPERTLTLFAARAPGRDHGGRPRLEGLLAHVGAEPNGALEEALGSAQARRCRPDLLDLGRVNGRGVSVLIGGALGEPDVSIGDATRAVGILSRSDRGGDLPESAQRVRATRYALESATPLGASITTGMALLYEDQGADRDTARVHRSGLGPWSYTYVTIGGDRQRDALSSLAEPSIWTLKGRKRTAGPHVRCLDGGEPGG